ncbi:ABC transporter substrate-binding protein [Neobacillus niacini]|uniref:ABC transporter substrate-binding protein n=1 Tax=Neobacillus niacini TaxID=86668 RepID=UPI0030008978
MAKILSLKKTILSALLVGVLFIFTACTGNDISSSSKGSSVKVSGSENKAQDRIVIATPFPLGAPAGTPTWLGETLGYFEEEGLEVEIVSLPGKPAETIGLVVAGKADIAFSQPDALVFPLADGKDQGLTWIFSPYQKPIFGIAVKKTSDISSPSQLENKTVGMLSLGAPFETFLNANVSADGGNPSTIDNVAIGSGAAALEALRKGDINAFVGNQADMATAALVTGTEIRLLPFPDKVGESFAAGFVMRKDTDKKKRDAIARYLRSVVKTGIFAQENPDKAVELNWEMYPASKPTDKSEEQAIKEAKVSLGVIANSYQSASNGQWGYISENRWQKFIESNGLTEKISDVTKLYDYSLLDLINSFNEEEVREQARNF